MRAGSDWSAGSAEGPVEIFAGPKAWWLEGIFAPKARKFWCPVENFAYYVRWKFSVTIKGRVCLELY